MYKKILASALALTLTFGAVGVAGVDYKTAATGITASALDEDYYQTEGATYSFKEVSDGQVVITDISTNKPVVTVPSTVKSSDTLHPKTYTVIALGEGCVAHDSSITSITLPATATTVNKRAFANCTNLYEVNLGGVSKIEENAFQNCSKLEKVNLNKVSKLGNGAFQNCTALKSITIPSKVLTIPNDIFSGCASLKTVVLPAGTKSICSGAFKNCWSLENINLVNTIAYIGDEAFSGCSILRSSQVKFSEGLAVIGNKAFNGCSYLKEVTLPTSVAYIGSNVFTGTDADFTIKYYNDTVGAEYAESTGFKKTLLQNPVTDNGNGSKDDKKQTVKVKPVAPKTVIAVGQKRKAVFKWSAVKGATSYQVLIKINGKWKIIKNATTTRRIVKTGLKSKKVYTFAVKTRNKNGLSKAAYKNVKIK